MSDIARENDVFTVLPSQKTRQEESVMEVQISINGKQTGDPIRCRSNAPIHVVIGHVEEMRVLARKGGR